MQRLLHIDAVLFDAAGTLLHVREAVGVTYARFAAAAGVIAEAERLDAAFRTTLRQMPPMVFPEAPPTQRADLERNWWRQLVRSTFATVEPAARFADFDHFFESVFRHFGLACAWTLIPSTSTVLTSLRAHGVRTGIVSNFDQRLHALLDEFHVKPLFDVIVLPADVGVAKPDPKIFSAALSRIVVEASRAVYVGDDADDDIAGAKMAGLHAVDVRQLPSLTALLDRIVT